MWEGGAGSWWEPSFRGVRGKKKRVCEDGCQLGGEDMLVHRVGVEGVMAGSPKRRHWKERNREGIGDGDV